MSQLELCFTLTAQQEKLKTIMTGSHTFYSYIYSILVLTNGVSNIATIVIGPLENYLKIPIINRLKFVQKAFFGGLNFWVAIYIH